MAVTQSWPARLQKSWHDQKINHQLINASISGDTTENGLQRLPKLLKTHHPDWLLIELGGNDGLQGLPTATTQANLARLIELAQNNGTCVILMQIRCPETTASVTFISLSRFTQH